MAPSVVAVSNNCFCGFVFSMSNILNSAWTIEDFPAPDLPTIPTFYPWEILKETPFKVGFRFSLYLMWTLWKTISPF